MARACRTHCPALSRRTALDHIVVQRFENVYNNAAKRAIRRFNGAQCGARAHHVRTNYLAHAWSVRTCDSRAAATAN
eukprot:11226745-Lingulodinium_polyedra.AAC.1